MRPLLLLTLLAVLLAGCDIADDLQQKRIERATQRQSEVFNLVRGDTVVLTEYYELAGLGTQDTATVFQVIEGSLVIVEKCDGERIHLHEKWFNPLRYERKECGE